MKNIVDKCVSCLWDLDLQSLPWWKKIAVNTSRFFYLIMADLANGQLNLRAMSLVFTTILSFVPLIAVSFSVLKAFGVHNQIEPVLLNLFAPLGSKAPELTQNMIGFVDNVKVGLLGTIGIAFLFYSVLSLVKKVEESFNYTWRIKKSRTLLERFSSYLSVLMVGPVLVIAAMGTTATLLNHSITQSVAAIEPFGTLLAILSKLLPYFFIIAAFTFTYAFVPNTKVRFTPALTGGVVAGVLWQSVGWLFAFFVAKSTAQNAIYAGSGFAIIFFFMTWLYLSWLILLVGSNVAFYVQFPENLRAKTRSLVLSNFDREYVAFNVLIAIAKNFYAQEAPLTAEQIANQLACPKQSVERAIACFEKADILRGVNGESSTYLPAVPLEDLLVADVYEAIRNCTGTYKKISVARSRENSAFSLMVEIEDSVNQKLGDLKVKELLYRV